MRLVLIKGAALPYGDALRMGEEGALLRLMLIPYRELA